MAEERWYVKRKTEPQRANKFALSISYGGAKNELRSPREAAFGSVIYSGHAAGLGHQKGDFGASLRGLPVCLDTCSEEGHKGQGYTLHKPRNFSLSRRLLKTDFRSLPLEVTRLSLSTDV